MKHHSAGDFLPGEAGLPRSVLIVGAGLAGLRTAQALRDLGFAGGLRMVGREKYRPYDRPPLSKSALLHDDGPAYLCSQEDLDGLEVDLILGHEAVGLDVASRHVVLANARELPYEACVLTPGAMAISPPTLAGRATFSIRSYDDVVGLRRSLTESAHVVIIGGGFIGCEAAAALRVEGRSVTLVEQLPGPLWRVLGPEASAEVTTMHREHGVHLATGVSVVSRHDEATCMTLELSDGQSLRSDITLLALGARPDTQWLAQTELAGEAGIECGPTGRTKVPGIWALGDAAAWWDGDLVRHVRSEHWTPATEQSEIVARDILGLPVSGMSGPSYFWSDQYGIKIQGWGDPVGATETRALRVGPKSRLLVLYGLAGTLVAGVGFGLPRQSLQVRRLVADGLSFEEAQDAVLEWSRVAPGSS